MTRKKMFLLVLFASLGSLFATKGHGQEIRGTYAIRNAETGIYIRIRDANTKNGTPIVAYSPVNWKCVTWDFKHTSGQAYQLTNLFSGKTLQPQGANAADGASLEEQPVAANLPNQQYEFIPVKEGNYLIRLKGTELYITPSDDKGRVNANIVLAKKNNSRLQQWTLKEQHPEM